MVLEMNRATAPITDCSCYIELICRQPDQNGVSIIQTGEFKRGSLTAESFSQHRAANGHIRRSYSDSACFVDITRVTKFITLSLQLLKQLGEDFVMLTSLSR